MALLGSLGERTGTSNIISWDNTSVNISGHADTFEGSTSFTNPILLHLYSTRLTTPTEVTSQLRWGLLLQPFQLIGVVHKNFIHVPMAVTRHRRNPTDLISPGNYLYLCRVNKADPFQGFANSKGLRLRLRPTFLLSQGVWHPDVIVVSRHSASNLGMVSRCRSRVLIQGQQACHRATGAYRKR